jgi:hypothetical protein
MDTTAPAARPGPFAMRERAALAELEDQHVHLLKSNVICRTEPRRTGARLKKSPLDLVIDQPAGFIALWAQGTVLRWRFQERSLALFQDPGAAAAAIEKLLGSALLAWGEAVPVTFIKRDEAWDFEIVVRDSDDCAHNGCVYARSFFPDAGRHELRIYPKMFSLDWPEQVETLCHELGHIFGLRHTFAPEQEQEWPSVVFGTHAPFSIMSYAGASELTNLDRDDLRRLYRAVWRGELTELDRVPFKLVSPYHTLGRAAGAPLAMAVPVQPAMR